MKQLLALFQVLLIAGCTVGCVRIATGPGALARCARVWREFRPGFRFAFLLWCGVFVFDLIQTELDAVFDRVVPVDFTPLFHQIEGQLPAQLQRALEHPLLTLICCFVYLIAFPAMLFGLAHTYDRLGDDASVRRVGLAYFVNYLLCLPFYLFFPIVEPWSFSPSGVLPLADTIHPWLIDIVRPMSGIDNCFPSYHCSLTVSLVLLAWETAPRRLARVVAVTGFLIVLSTVYLGFHWFLDMAAGVAAGAAVHVVVRRLVLGEEPVFAAWKS